MADPDKDIAPVDNEVQNDGPINNAEVPIERKGQYQGIRE